MLPIQEPDLESLLALLAGQEDFVFLDTSRPDPENSQSLLFLDPKARLVCRVGDDPGEYLGRLQSRLDQGFFLAGWLAYEFGALLEAGLGRMKSSAAGTVLASFGVFTAPYRFNHQSGDHDFPLSTGDKLAESDYAISGLRANMSREECLAAIERVRDYIGAGDSYQVNYTMKLLFDFAGSPEGLYRTLRHNQSVAYGAYLRHGAERILSFSPELFFKKDREKITVRPMKGTFTKGRTCGEEQANASLLHFDQKNRSENVMIVDLLRNDLARLIHGHGPGRVEVVSLFAVEPYESLLQMTSTIRGRVEGGELDRLRLEEIFRALFPCGSITGAPKIRTMEIIDELETDRRGVYTGAIGYLAPDASAVFNVPIRTIHLRGNRGEMGIGAGITYDSKAAEEWDESLLKGRFLSHSQPRFYLFETILWQRDSRFWLLERHLDRLAESARFFRFFCDPAAIRDRLHREEADFSEACYRLRLVLEKDGRVELSASPWSSPAALNLPLRPKQGDDTDDLPVIDFADTPTETDGPWLFHKTSRRGLYDRHYRQAGSSGLYDLIFCNGAGEVTEGSISSLFVYDGTGYLTPPVACGLLPGVLRAELLAGANPVVREAVLRREEVYAAPALFVGNSLRGVVQVRLRGC
jgi:para-aminobenzoate synthetase/4-amino-4-deoxychorismate lyase